MKAHQYSTLISGKDTLPGENTLHGVPHGLHRKEFIFVSGIPRSGTTALAKLLNLSPEITIFFELFPAFREYRPSDFSAEQLEEIISELPDDERIKIYGIAKKTLTSQLLEKTASSKFVGDKRPLFLNTLPATLEHFSEEKVDILHILRAVDHVILSYYTRASDPQSPWPPSRSFEQLRDPKSTG